ncbi:MAG: hypothetical protein LBE08_02210 [Bifidobacteriaceae bacterium]|jgi:hypothetical protein|nr:hypothetical protein [Bifidobacteriaceae bacterium]
MSGRSIMGGSDSGVWIKPDCLYDWQALADALEIAVRRATRRDHTLWAYTLESLRAAWSKMRCLFAYREDAQLLAEVLAEIPSDPHGHIRRAEQIVLAALAADAEDATEPAAVDLSSGDELLVVRLADWQYRELAVLVGRAVHEAFLDRDEYLGAWPLDESRERELSLVSADVLADATVGSTVRRYVELCTLQAALMAAQREDAVGCSPAAPLDPPKEVVR